MPQLAMLRTSVARSTSHKNHISSSLRHSGVAKSQQSIRLVPRVSLPAYLDDNIYLLHSHRPELQSYVDCLRSLFVLHTETLNIWTHLAAFVACPVVFYHVVCQSDSSSKHDEVLMSAMYFLGALLSLAASTAFHAFGCYSQQAYNLFQRSIASIVACTRLDYSGIILAILTGQTPYIYFMFYCQPVLRYSYISAEWTLGCTILTLIFTYDLGSPEHIRIRTVLFCAMGLSGVIPTAHYVLFIVTVQPLTGIQWLGTSGVIYLTGSALFALRIPERLCPGACDIWFHAHQLFHVCVVGGLIAAYIGLVHLMHDFRTFDCRYPQSISTDEIFPQTSY